VLAKQPDRLGVGSGVGKLEAEKAHEGKAVMDLKLGRVVGQSAERLQDQNLEDQRASGRGDVGTVQRFRQGQAKHLEIDQLLELRQRIAPSENLR
jgi:hypothetical protein